MIDPKPPVKLSAVDDNICQSEQDSVTGLDGDFQSHQASLATPVSDIKPSAHACLQKLDSMSPMPEDNDESGGHDKVSKSDQSPSVVDPAELQPYQTANFEDAAYAHGLFSEFSTFIWGRRSLVQISGQISMKALRMPIVLRLDVKVRLPLTLCISYLLMTTGLSPMAMCPHFALSDYNHLNCGQFDLGYMSFGQSDGCFLPYDQFDPGHAPMDKVYQGYLFLVVNLTISMCPCFSMVVIMDHLDNLTMVICPLVSLKMDFCPQLVKLGTVWIGIFVCLTMSFLFVVNLTIFLLLLMGLVKVC